MDRVREGMQKRVRRFQQLASQNVGLAERKDELQGVSQVDQRIQRMVAAVVNTRQNIQKCLPSAKDGKEGKEESIEKRRRRLDEFSLAMGLHQDAKDLEAVNEGSLLSDIMLRYSEALGELIDERVQTDIEVEKKVLDCLNKYQEEEKAIHKIKEKLNRTTLDLESSRRRLHTAPPDRAGEIQDEFDSTQYKVDNYKDNAIADMFTLAAKEVEIASIFSLLVEIQAEYHRTAIRTLENVLPEITKKIATYGRRPVFGCPLEDHLRFSHRKIALVLEVCCSALCIQGLTEEGLFRISGNATKVRRLKAGFDAHEFDLSDYVNDPHSLAGVLKSYLRELPEPLMGNNMHNEWVRAGRMDGEERKAAIRDILSLIPAANRDNLAYLIKFLQRLHANEEHTRMSASNLSIVMGPNLIGNAGGDGDNMLGSRLVETLLVHADYFFPEDIDFKSDYTRAFASKFADETGGFEANDRMPPKSTQYPVRHDERPQSFGSQFDPHGSASQMAGLRNVSPSVQRNNSNTSTSGMAPPLQAQRRPKQPAPPPPPNKNDQRPTSTGEYDNVSPVGQHPPAAMSQSLIDFDTEVSVSKSPSVASNDSMTEYGADTHDALRNDRLVEYDPPKPARRASPSRDSVGSLPEDPPQNAEKESLINVGKGPPTSLPVRPPPPTQTALERNAVARESGSRGRPTSYMNAVSNIEVDADTNGNQNQHQPQPQLPPPIRPPIAPRRTHLKTASVDENRTVLTINNDSPTSPDSSKPRPPIPAKPPRAVDESSVTKL